MIAFTINGVVYLKNIANRLANIRHHHRGYEEDAFGTGANFHCGSFVRFYLSIEVGGSVIENLSFRSNGCGYVAASAELLAGSLAGRRLTDLQGLTDDELTSFLFRELGEIPSSRRECIEACIHALRSSFAALRASRVAEFAGDEALICTCFGVTEQRIEAVISETRATTVEDVSAACNAGLGCGSCRMMIEELIDCRVP